MTEFGDLGAIGFGFDYRRFGADINRGIADLTRFEAQVDRISAKVRALGVGAFAPGGGVPGGASVPFAPSFIPGGSRVPTGPSFVPTGTRVPIPGNYVPPTGVPPRVPGSVTPSSIPRVPRVPGGGIPGGGVGAGIAASRRGGLGIGRLVGIGTGIAVTRDTISAITDFDDALADLQAQSNLTSDEIERLRNVSLAAGRDTKFTATQSLETAKELARSGQLIGEVEDSLRPALNLAAVAQIEGGRAAVITARSLKQFNLEARESGRLIDQLTFAASRTTAGVGEFSRAGPKLFPAANAAGLDSADALAFAAVLADAGFVGEQGGVAGRNLILNLQKRQQPGQSFFDTLSTLSTEDLDLLGAKDLVNQRGAAPLLATLQNVSGIRQLAEDIRDFSEGDAARRAEEQLDSIGGAYTRLGSAIENVQVQIGQAGAGQFLENIGNELTAFVRGIGGADLQDIPEDMHDLAEAGLAVRDAISGIAEAGRPFIEFLDAWGVRAADLVVNTQLLGTVADYIGDAARYVAYVGGFVKPGVEAVTGVDIGGDSARQEAERSAARAAQEIRDARIRAQRRGQGAGGGGFAPPSTLFGNGFEQQYEDLLGPRSEGDNLGLADRRRGVLDSLRQEERALGLSTRERQAYNATVAATGVVYAEIDPEIQRYVDSILGLERANIVLEGSGRALTDLGLQAIFAADNFEDGAERIVRSYAAMVAETLALQPASEAFIGLLRDIGISLGASFGSGATSRHVAGGEGVTYSGGGHTPGGG